MQGCGRGSVVLERHERVETRPCSEGERHVRVRQLAYSANDANGNRGERWCQVTPGAERERGGPGWAL